MEIGQCAGSVANEFPSLALCHIAYHLVDVATFAERHGQIGLTVVIITDAEVERTQQVTMVGVDHQCKLTGQHLHAILVHVLVGRENLESQRDSRLSIYRLPHLCECSSSDRR